MDARDESEELATLRCERDAAREAEGQLQKQLEDAEARLKVLDKELAEATAELLDRAETLEAEGHGDLSESGDSNNRDHLIMQVEEVHDLVDCKQWEIEDCRTTNTTG